MNNRLISLDAFRGFTVAAMILVNYPGDWENVYGPLLHAEWDEPITPTDLIFPFFLFIVGVSITLAYTRQLQSGKSKFDIQKRVLWRAVKIFALGVFLNLFPAFDFSELRWPGVLQRIAVVFLVCALIFVNTSWKTQARLGVAFLLLYWVLMAFVPVPGLGTGVFEPGRNMAAWLDSLWLPGKMWEGTWDPEGILSSLPALVTGISGMLAGHLIQSQLPAHKKLVGLYFAGFCSLAVGYLWGWVFPINKHVWTSSYVLYTSGLAALTLASFVWLIDELGYKRWTAVGVIYGSNAITAYFLAGVFGLFVSYPESANLQSGMMSLFGGVGLSPRAASLAWALFYNLLCFLPVYFLYRRGLFIKL
jgi:predicted acyltransferase